MPRAAHAFGVQYLAHLFEAGLHIIIDDDKIIAIPMADFAFGLRHAPRNNLFAIRAAFAQPFIELLNRGRENEHPHHITLCALVKLLRALPVNIKQKVIAVFQALFHRRFGRAIFMVKHMRPFQQGIIINQRLKLFIINEMIINPVHFAFAAGAGGDGDGEANLFIAFQNHPRNGGFSSARG